MQTIDFNRLKLRSGDKVLDVGCGEGRHSIAAWLEAKVDVTGLDLCENDLQTARNKQQEAVQYLEGSEEDRSIKFIQGNALELPFEDNTFDKIICSEVLEHIPDYQGVLAEIKRVLKPDGLLAVSVPRAWPEEICWKLSKAYHQVEGGHIRIFNSTHLRHDIESLGWQRYSRHWAHALHSPYWWLKCWKWEQPSKLVDQYHKLLVWDLMEKPWVTRTAEKLLDPVMGKSVVMYFEWEPGKGKSESNNIKKEVCHG
ncbi:class I SAM-dependent methyltransferase [Endozoicomonas arenosclerae]|uniref:class I SAM-dependent methyltransferase n=1 Tax=Endozoicomonas arenosclerae TaxID=1633495 RepID=UPI0009A1D70F|nr:class I SAM-dependent methyltransferase [Endozoicomonas arenosclerae]